MSNDLKYVLLPTVDDQRRSPKFQPWYRERIRMKYPCNINTKKWKFVKDGLDDFRDGLPPSHDDIILEADKGTGPVVISENRRRIKSCAANIEKRLSEHQIYFSKEIPAAERRRRTIDNYIATLLEHPIAFFEHFKQMLLPETYERVTKLFEAELSRSNTDEHISSSGHQTNNLSSSSTQIETSESEKDLLENIAQEAEKTTSKELSDDLITKGRIDLHNRPSGDSDSKSSSTKIGRNAVVYDEAGNQWSAEEYAKRQKNPYQWFIEKQRQKQRAKGPSQDEQAAAAMEARLRSVSEQFCTWLYDLGGETNTDIEPAVVRNLFSTAYDTKPSLSVPIKIVEMTRIPIELRDGAQDAMIPGSEQTKETLSELRSKSAGAKPRSIPTTFTDHEPRTQKYRYGAWYLPKTLWQRSLRNEQLLDPKVIRAEREDTARKREEHINARLAPLHGVNAFRDYLQENHIRRVPKLITDVEQYRRDHPLEQAKPVGHFQTKRSGLATSEKK